MEMTIAEYGNKITIKDGLANGHCNAIALLLDRLAPSYCGFLLHRQTAIVKFKGCSFFIFGNYQQQLQEDGLKYNSAVKGLTFGAVGHMCSACIAPHYKSLQGKGLFQSQMCPSFLQNNVFCKFLRRFSRCIACHSSNTIVELDCEPRPVYPSVP